MSILLATLTLLSNNKNIILKLSNGTGGHCRLWVVHDSVSRVKYVSYVNFLEGGLDEEAQI